MARFRRILSMSSWRSCWKNGTALDAKWDLHVFNTFAVCRIHRLARDGCAPSGFAAVELIADVSEKLRRFLDHEFPPFPGNAVETVLRDDSPRQRRDPGNAVDVFCDGQ